MPEINNTFNNYSVSGLNHDVQEDGEIGHRLNHIGDKDEWDYDQKFHNGEDRNMGTMTSEWPDDERTYSRVCDALFRDGVLESTEIDIEVDNGIVTLKGMVSDLKAKKYADDTLDKVFGVIEVKNNLKIKENRGLVGNTNGWPV